MITTVSKKTPLKGKLNVLLETKSRRHRLYINTSCHNHVTKRIPGDSALNYSSLSEECSKHLVSVEMALVSVSTKHHFK